MMSGSVKKENGTVNGAVRTDNGNEGVVSKGKGKIGIEVKNVEGLTGVQEKDALAYMNNYKAHKPGISHEEMVHAYSDWASTYDQDLSPGVYNGPEIAATALAGYYVDKEARADLKILDVAAGTGRVGGELVKQGFRNIDALEPSEGMLKRLAERGVYNVSYQCAVGTGTSNQVPSDVYDCLVIAGGMGEGHIPVSAIDEMIRFVRPGGTVFIVMREEYLTYVKEYVNRLEPYMDQLEKQGLWRKIAKNIVPHYSFNKNGVVFSYEVIAKNG